MHHRRGAARRGADVARRRGRRGLRLPQPAARRGRTTTVESKTNFFRALREGTARAVARPLHTGRSFIVVQTDLYDDEGRQLGQTTQTQAVLLPRA
ncbi:PaaI family thioesterase [Actinomadura keratinilytica]